MSRSPQSHPGLYSSGVRPAQSSSARGAGLGRQGGGCSHSRIPAWHQERWEGHPKPRGAISVPPNGIQTLSHSPPSSFPPLFTQTQQNDKKRAAGWNHQARGCAEETQRKQTQEVASETTPPAPRGQAKNTSFGKDNAQQEAGRDTTAPPPLHHQCWACGWCTPAMPPPVPPKSIKAHEVTKKRGNFK